MHTFTDRAGRDWNLEANIFTIGQARKATGIDLSAILDNDAAVFCRLMSDHLALVDILFAMVKGQAADSLAIMAAAGGGLAVL